MIYGLAAAVGWGLADFSGAVAGRRIGSVATVIVGQVLSALFMTALLLISGEPVAPIGAIIGWVALNGLFTAIAYMTHYRALELGPVAVVSPVGATYAVVGVALAMIVLGERPDPPELIGAAITVFGVMLVSTDLRKLRAGTHGMPPGLPWAIVSAVGFGVAAFLLGYAAQQIGWISGLWASRMAQVTCYIPIAIIYRKQLSQLRPGVGLWVALAAGAADILGVVTYASRRRTGLPHDRARRERDLPDDRRGAVDRLPPRAVGAQPVRGHRVRRGRADAAGIRLVRARRAPRIQPFASLISNRCPSGSRKNPRISQSDSARGARNAGAAGREHLVGTAAIRDPKGHGVAHVIGVGRRLEGHGGLVVGGVADRHQQEPRAEELQHAGRPAVLPDHRGPEDIAVERDGGREVAHHQDVGEFATPVRGGRFVGHFEVDRFRGFLCR